jgi:hypothetical protein
MSRTLQGPSANSQDEELLRVDELPGASVRWWWNEIHAGRLVHIRLGRRVWIKRGDLEAYLDERRVRGS